MPSYTKSMQFIHAVFLTALCCQTAEAEVNALIFPELTISDKPKPFSGGNVSMAIDLFVSADFGGPLVLAEAYVSDKVQHFERLQLGLNITDSSRLWVGRYHNPFGYWHTEYHHGKFLQTSISRPSLVALGGSGGIVPSHATGGLLEGELERNNAGWHYTLSVGYTSLINLSGSSHRHVDDVFSTLHDLDVLDWKAKRHNLGYSARLAYLPDALEENQFGAFIGRYNIAIIGQHHQISENGKDNVELDVVGIFANYQFNKLRVISELYHFSNAIDLNATENNGSFSAAYLQAEYHLNHHWIPFARLESSFGEKDNPYLSLLSGLPDQTAMLGLRFDASSKHAFKIEYLSRVITGERSGLWSLSWNAVLP